MAIHEGDIGTSIEIPVVDPAGDPVDISGATSFIIYWRDPDDETGSWTAQLKAATTDTIQFITIAGSLSTFGAWKIQGYVALASWEGRTVEDTMTVEPKVENSG